jgi:glycosyltransferase involved in cell wall biosynthesis
LEHRRSAESAAVYVSENNNATLGLAIRQLLLDPERRETMSQFARQRFREVLAWENSEQQLVALYRQLFEKELTRSMVNSVSAKSVTADDL